MDESVQIIKRLNKNSLKFILNSFSKSGSGRILVLRSRVTRLASVHAVNKKNVSIFDLLREMDAQGASGSHTDSSSDSPIRPKQKSLKRTTRSSSGVDIVEIRRGPVHPDVRFRNLPFYEVIDELIKPTALSNSGRFNNTGHVFHLTPTQVEAIKKESRNRKEFSVQVQVRIGLLETTSPQEDNFPPGVMVRMNGQDCYCVPSTPLPSSSGTRGSPIDVTRYVYLDPSETNVVQVTYLPHFQPYVVAVYLVRARSWEDLLKKMKLKGRRNSYYTQGMIQQKLRADDSEIATTHLRVHLVCPLGKMRMSNPCRAVTCQHVQCFDASIYLQLNEKSAKWICPVCNMPALFKDLVIDEYFVKVLASENLPSGCTEIQVMSDGGWQATGVTSDAPVKAPSASTSRISSVDIQSSEDECEVLEERAAAPTRRAKSPVTVDLISSQSSDCSSSSPPESPSYNLPPKKRKQVFEFVDEICLSSDSEPESFSSRTATSLSQSDSDSSLPVVRNMRRKQDLKIVSRPTTMIFKRRTQRTREMGFLESPKSPEPESPHSPEYTINTEKSTLTTLVMRKRSTYTPESTCTVTTQENTISGKEISQSILDSIITSVVESHESEMMDLFNLDFNRDLTDIDLKNEATCSDSELKVEKPPPPVKRSKPPGELFVPSILKRSKPVEVKKKTIDKKETLLLPLVRPRAHDKPKRKNLSEVVKHLQPREPSPPMSNFDHSMAGPSLSPPPYMPDFYGTSERELMPRNEFWSRNPYFPMPRNESENLVTSSFLPCDFRFTDYGFDGSSASSISYYEEDWLQPLSLSRRDPNSPSTSFAEISYSPAHVAENRAEQSNSRLPAILRKSREKK